MSAPADPPRKRSRWWRRLLWGSLVLLVAARLALWVALPRVLVRLAADRGLRLEIGDIDLSISTARVDVWHVKLAPESAASDPAVEPWLDLEYLTLNVDVSGLLAGDLRVHRAEIDGVDVLVERDAEGTVNWQSLISPDSDSDDAAPPESETELSFAPPFEVEALRVQHAHVHVRDQLPDPPFDETLHLSLRVSDVGSSERSTRIELEAAMNGVVDALQLAATGDASRDVLLGQLELNVVGLHPPALWPYLPVEGVQPVAGDLALRCELDLSLKQVDRSRPSFAIRAELIDTWVRADLRDELRLGRLAVETTEVSAAGLRGLTIALEDSFAHAAIDEAGSWSVLGFALDPASSPKPEEPPESAPFSVELLGLSASATTLAFEDASATPPAELRVDLDALESGPVRVEDGVLVGEVTARTSLRAEGVADTMELAVGYAPQDEASRIDVDLDADGVTLEEVRAYLRAVSIDPTLSDGRLRLAGHVLTASDGERLRLEVGLDDLLISDRGVVLAAGTGAMRGFVNDSSTATLDLGDIELAGVRLHVARDADGELEWPGFRIYHDPTVEPDEDSAESEDAPSSRVAFHSLILAADELVYEDATLDPPATMRVTEVDGVAERLVFGRREADDEASSMRLQLAADRVCESWTFTGRMEPPADGVRRAEGELHVTGMTYELAAPYLRAAGIESSSDRGELTLRMAAGVRTDGDATLGDGTLSGSFQIGGETAFAIERLEVQSLRVAPGEVAAGSVLVDQPIASMARRADGAFGCGGLWWRPSSGDASSAAPPISPGTPDTSDRPDVAAMLDRMELRGARVRWSDQAVQPEVRTELSMDATLEGMALGGASRPFTFRFEGRADGIVDSLSLAGSATPDPSDLSIDARVELRGARPAAVAPYAADAARLDLRDGRLSGRLRGRVANHTAGGRSVAVELDQLDYRDGDQTPWLSIERLELNAPRLDPEGNVFEVDRVGTRGVSLRLVRDGESWRALGLRPSGPGPDVAADPSPATDDEPAIDPLSFRLDAPPTLRVGAIDVGVDRLIVEDRGGLGVIEGRVRCATPRSLLLMGPDASVVDPLLLRVDAAAPPFVATAAVDLEVDPFDVDPHVYLDVALRGVRGAELTRALPSLAGRVDVSSLVDGELTGHGELLVEPRGPRRSRFDLDLSSGFGADLQLSNVQLRERSGAPPVAGFDSLVADVSRVDPSTRAVTVRRLELWHPFASVRREADRTVVSGLGFINQEEGETTPPGAAEVEAPASADSSADRGEIRVDTLVVADAGIEYVDATVEPPLHLPVADLDVEVRQISSHLLSASRPIRFRAQAVAGDVRLPKRSERSNLLFDIASGVTRTAKEALGVRKDVQYEQRPAFDIIDIAGRLTLAPRAEGFVKATVRGLELVNFAGLAGAAGVRIGDGVLDDQLDVRFRGDEGVAIANTANFSRLSLSEPADGPISRALKLGSPLEVVLFVLRDDTGDIKLPLTLDIGAQGMSRTALLSVVAGALARVIGDAVAASPFRVARTVTDLAKLLPMPSSEPAVGPPLEITFTPSSTAIDAESAAAVRELGKALAADPTLLVEVDHAFGRAGLQRIATLANPPRERAAELAASLREQKAEIQAEQVRLMARAKSETYAGERARVQRTVERLRALDARLATTEAALDRTLALLQQNADRRREQRVREACLEVAGRRLAVINALLRETAGESAMARCRVRRPRYEADPPREQGAVTLTRRRTTRP